MSNDTAKTITTNLVPVQGIFEPLPPYDCVTLIGPAGTPFSPPIDDIDGATINDSTIGLTVPAAAAFTTASSLAQPVQDTDLCNKLYVDAAIVGISWKEPVRTASTANLTLSGTQTVDGVALVAGDRVLVKDQSTQANNGIYVVAAGAWSRAPDADTWDELVSALLFVESGGQAGAAFYCPIQPGGTLGVTAITFNNFNISGTYFAGTGLTLTGSTFSITNTAVTPESYGSASAVPTITVNAQGQLTAASNTNIAIAGSAITSGTIDSARLSGTYSGITGVGTLANLTVSSTITGSISGNAATATSATSATTATNLAGGANGSLPYQTGSGATTFLAAGSNGQYLTLSSGVPAWATITAGGDVSGPASSVDTQIARFDGTTGKVIDAASVTISDAGAIGNVNEINWDITPTGVVGGAGSLAWNDDDNTQTLDLVGAGGNVTIALGEETYYRVRASANITKGQVVMFTGTVGASGGLEAAPATGLTASTSQYVMGIAAETFTSGNWGYIAAFGEVRGFDTTGGGESWVNGQILYLNPSVAGGLTKTVPAAPAAKVEVCAVVYADASVGSVFVRPTFFPSLNQLNDVSAATPSGGDLLIYDNGDSRWENTAQSNITAGKATNIAGGAAGSLPYQSTADTTTFLAAGSDGQVLKLASGVPTWSSDASGVTITDDTTTNATRYLTFTDATTGTESGLDVSSTKLQFNPLSGVVSATGLNLSGLTASNIVATDGSKNLSSVATTGSGDVVLATSPTLTTPVLGTPTSGNLSNCTVDGTDAVGFRNTPINSQSTAYTAVLADSGKTILHPASDDNARTFTIPANSSVAYPLGTVLTFVNLKNTVTIAITTDTMYLAGPGTTGSRTLAEYGVATAVKVDSTSWIISGNGLT